MANFALLDENNIVQNVDVVNNETIDNLPFPQSEPVGIAFLQTIYGPSSKWAQTSFSGSFRYRYAGIGYFFDESVQAFIAPKPFPSWLLNTADYSWQAPVPYPTDGEPYSWDETTQSWVIISPPSE